VGEGGDRFISYEGIAGVGDERFRVRDYAVSRDTVCIAQSKGNHGIISIMHCILRVLSWWFCAKRRGERNQIC
jgi:hypothetical protein